MRQGVSAVTARVTVLGIRAGRTGWHRAMRGLGSKARMLGIFLGAVVASMVFEWQGGAPISEPCPGGMTACSRGLAPRSAAWP